jgi:O-antigen/teichoic acid export membrane protein
VSDPDYLDPPSVPPSASEHSKGITDASVKRGSLWALAGYGGSQVLRLGGNLILWRLLYPEAFGLMALVNVFITGLMMFSDVGIGPSIVQNPRGDEPAFLNTAWTIQVVRGFALGIAGAILAAPVAAFYQEPQLFYLVPVVALNSVVSGFNSTSVVSATRHIQLARTTIVDLSSQAVGLLAMIVWGVVYHNIWALVIGGSVTAVVRLILSHTFLPGIRNRLFWDKECATSLLSFGRWIFFSTLLTFAVSQSDRLLFGKLLPMDQLGVYSIATVLAALPSTVLGSVVGSVVFSLLSRVHNSGGNVLAALLSSRRPWLMLCGYGISCLVAGGPALVLFLYDTKATEAGWMTQMLAAGSWFYALESSNSRALLALGKSNWLAMASLAKLLGMIVCIPLGMKYFGFPGAVAGLAGSEMLRYAASLVGCARMRLNTQLDDLQLTLVLVASTLLGVFVAAQIRSAFGADWSGWVRLPYLVEALGVGLSVALGWGALFLKTRARLVTAH